jgi:hypothetical protein
MMHKTCCEELKVDEFPKTAVTVQGYMSKMRGDKLWYTFYVNPEGFGFEDQAGLPSKFREKAGGKLKDATAAMYVDGLMEWANNYTNQVESAYLSGTGFRLPEVAELKLNGFDRAGVAGASPTIGSLAAPNSTAVSAAPVPPPMPAQIAAVPAVQQTAPVTTLVATPIQTGARPLKSYALVIGNSAYPGAALVNPKNDAQAIAKKLKSYGLSVDLVLDAKRSKLVDALTAFATKAHDADVTILFYAGHGMQVNGINYLIPVDMNLGRGSSAAKVSFEAVSLNTLVEEHLPGKTKIVFLDACRDNPLARSIAGTRGASRGLAAVNAATGTLIAYATRDGSTASDGNSSNSPYTTALLAHLDESEDIALVLRKVRQKVMTSTRGAQEPWEYGSLIGDKLVLSQLGLRR